MSDDLRARADARLEKTLADAPFRDPRPYLRRMLKDLKERDPEAFERALAHFESELVPAVAGDGDPMAAWMAYGLLLASLAGDGEVVAIDGTGRATPAGDAPPAEAVVLYLPASSEVPAAVLRCPRDATPAQEASIELLVLGRVGLSDRLAAISGG